MIAAFKEWRVVVDALGRGEQIFILRKGGIHEGRGGFKMDYMEFALFPTEFHQQRDSVIPSAQARFDERPGINEATSSVFYRILRRGPGVAPGAGQVRSGPTTRAAHLER